MSADTDTIGSAAADAVSALLRREVQAHLAATHIYRDGHLELIADATGMAPMVEGFPTAETRRG